jgi:hypothetical protein
MPGVPLGRRLAAFVRAGLFYAAWYPSRWIGWGRWPRYASFGRLADHLRWVERTSRRLARQQFHLMVLYGPALERKQAPLFRCVDIGAELYAMSAVCVRARRDAAESQSANAIELADLFCRQARLKVERLFEAIQHNADPEAYDVARAALDDRYAWLERGIIEAPDAAAPAETASARTASR